MTQNAEIMAAKPAEKPSSGAIAAAKWPRRLLSAGIVFCGSSGFLLRRVRDLLMALILLALFAAGLARFKDIAKYPLLENVRRYNQRIETPLLEAVRRIVPTNFQGHDVSRWLLFGAVYFFSVGFGMAGVRLSRQAAQCRRRRAELDAPSSLLKKAASGGKLKRKDLLEIYAQAKKSLDEHKSNLAFLSIDVVDSTGMKVGEEPGIAERDFRRYKNFVDEIIKANHALKSTWTPDGVMICFGAVADAVRSGQDIIIGLEKFNREIKLIKRDFAIRAGINSGEVFCDDATPMEEMTDRVIDIAGHMQKHGCVNGIAISKHAIEPLLGEFQFADAARVVDGCPVYEWKPKA